MLEKTLWTRTLNVRKDLRCSGDHVSNSRMISRSVT